MSQAFVYQDLALLSFCMQQMDLEFFELHLEVDDTCSRVCKIKISLFSFFILSMWERRTCTFHICLKDNYTVVKFTLVTAL